MNNNRIVTESGSLVSFRTEYQREIDGYINFTKLTKRYFELTGKRKDTRNWLTTKRTEEDIQHLSTVTGIHVTELVQVIQGGDPELQGTWGHPKLSLRFGVWLSSEFGYAVEVWFEDWVKEKGLAELRAEQSLLIEQARKEIKQETEAELQRAIAIHTQNITQQVAVQQNNFAVQLWQRFSFEFEKEFSKVRQEWLNFYEKYKTQEQELESLKVEFDIFFHGKVEGVAPGWNVSIWRELSQQDKLNFWKKHKLDGWMPSDQFQAQYKNILPSAPIEQKILEQQHSELQQIMTAPTSEEISRIERLKNEVFKRLDEGLS